MHAMILAAGRGERMRPLTDTVPKPLLRVKGRCLIEYHLDRLVAAGLTDIVINHAYLGQQIEDTLGDGQRYGAQIHYSPEGSQALGTAGGIVQALPLLGNKPFVVINGDIWCDYPLEQLPKQLLGLAHLILVNNPEHHPQGDFYLQTHWIHPTGHTRLTFSGLGVYHPQLFHHCSPGFLPLAPVLIQAIQLQQVSGEHYLGHWLDIGTPKRLEQLERFLSA